MLPYIEKFYGKEFLEKLNKNNKIKQDTHRAPYFLIGDYSHLKNLREEYNKYLELAYHHNIVNDRLKSRLKSKDWKIFFQVHAELMCAYFIKKILNYNISFYPQGSGNTIGDILLKYSCDENIFIEVKSPIRETPCKSTNIIQQNFKKAKRKMPTDRKNMMILAGDLKIPIYSNASDIIDVLYRKEVYKHSVNLNGKGPLLSYKQSGLFFQRCNTQIGAVATITYLSGDAKYIFEVYHNPYAKNPIDITIFKSCPQFVSNREKNRMEWIDK